MDEDFELARIQMPSNPFLSMIPASQLLAAFRTSPKHLALMLEPDIHTAFRRLQVNFAYKPGALDAQNLPVKINIPHRRSPPGNRQHYAATHGKPGRTKPAKPAVVHLHDVFSGLRPGEAMLFQALLPETASVLAPRKNLDDRPAAVEKYEQAAGENIHLQMIGK